MKFEFTKEWAESVPLEDDLLDLSVGRLSNDSAELAGSASVSSAPDESSFQHTMPTQLKSLGSDLAKD